MSEPVPFLGGGLEQPDQRSCGAASLVAARMLVDPDYAALAAHDFAHEALAMHHRLTGAYDAAGRLQLPWPRAIGTPPWAVARQMSLVAGPGLPGVDHDVHVARWGRQRRDRLFDRLRAATGDGRPCPVYVGNRWLPRHVLLTTGATATGLRVYNPARGTVADVDRADFVTGPLPHTRWTHPWFAVLPDGP